MRQQASLLDTVATSGGTSVLLGVAALIMSAFAPGVNFVNMAISVAIAVGLLPVIRHFNLIHNGSPIACGLFLLLQTAMAATDTDGSFIGPGLAAVALGGSALLFSSYQNRKRTDLIFTLMFAVGIGSMFSWAFAPLFVVFLIGIIQIGAFSFRGLIAALIGLITGPLLIYGFGLMVPALPTLPQFQIELTQFNIHAYAGCGLGAFLCLIFGGSCLLVSYGYPARTRSYNGLIYIITVYALAMPVADPAHSAHYCALLNLCAAYHTGHFAVTHLRGWVAVTFVILCSLALFVWNLCTL